MLLPCHLVPSSHSRQHLVHPSRCASTPPSSRPLCWQPPLPQSTPPSSRDRPTAPATPCRRRPSTRIGLTKSAPTHGRSTLAHNSSVRNGRISTASGGTRTLLEQTQSTTRLSGRLLGERFWFRHVSRVACQVRCCVHVYMWDMRVGCADDAMIIRHSGQLDALLVVLDLVRCPFGLDW